MPPGKVEREELEKEGDRDGGEGGETENKKNRKIQVHGNTGKDGKSKRAEEREGLEGAGQKGAEPRRMRGPEREEGGTTGVWGQRQGRRDSFVRRWEIVVDKQESWGE